MINIVITSDIKIYCEGLGQLFARTEDVNVVAIVDNYEATISSISARSPEILLLDMTMARSYQLAQQISQFSPVTKIVALAVSYNENKIVQCAEAGITCYVPREASFSELIEALREAAKGECYCPPKIAACLLKKMKNLALSEKSSYWPEPANDLRESAGCDIDRLTQREQQIARLLTEGKSNKEIARALSIEVSTVKNHVHNVLVKLEVNSRNQAVFCLRYRSLYGGTESMDLDPLAETPT